VGLLGDEVLLLEGESSTDSTGLLVSEVKGDVFYQHILTTLVESTHTWSSCRTLEGFASAFG
jgi:hypothetical protein